MSAHLTPRELVIGLLSTAASASLASLADQALHHAVVRAIQVGSPAAVHPELAGHRPDAVTGRRVLGLDDALRELAREGVLQWRSGKWKLRSRERNLFLRHRLPRLADDEVVGLDLLARDWQALVAVQLDRERSAAFST